MKRVKVKICGITSREQALAIAALDVDALGFVLYQKSPRYIAPEKIQSIVQGLPPFTKSVGVFVNEPLENLIAVMQKSGLDVAQLSGDESVDYCQRLTQNNVSWLRSFRIREPSDIDPIGLFPARYILLDAWSDNAYGGTGKTFDWNLVHRLSGQFEIILAGGINAENAEMAIRKVQPYGLDISSGVEDAPGIKSLDRVKILLDRIRSPRHV